MSRRAKPMLVAGLMSGTSADGIDVAVVQIAGRPPRLDARLLAFGAFPYPWPVRDAVLRVARGGPTTTGEISHLNVLLGELFATALLALCRRKRIPPRRIALLGSHGQTVFHQGRRARFLSAAKLASTLQIGDPSVIAQRTGIPTVGDFRLADMAAGGQGAPLVPFVDYLLYRHRRRGRVALNIGGIANVTVIPPAAEPEDVLAFDTGPGNMILDALTQRLTRGRRPFDRDARMAAAGRLEPALLAILLREPYFRQRPPKSCGHEQFGAAFAEQILVWGKTHRTPASNLLYTAAQFTAATIVGALRRYVLPRTRIAQIIVSGGGARNPLIMKLLREGLDRLSGGRRIEIMPSSRIGVSVDAKEAFAFAILAYETWHGRAANLPAATGANRPVILGKICRAG
jgi:anhydro-N-acetylmuramic acid kinase